MPFTQLANIRAYYEIAGTGPRLLAISGTGGDLRKRPNVFDSPLAQHFEILAYDQRGLGQTDRPDIPYTMQDYADDAARLLDAVGWSSALVMGTSFGGMVAQEFALRHPQRVEKLVLACTSSGGPGGASYPLHELGPMTPEERFRHTAPISDMRCTPEWQAAHADEFQAMLDFTLAQMQIGADEPNRAIGARRQLEARMGHDTFGRLPQLAMPVFICGGRYDGLAPVSNLEALLSQIPSATMELFEGGHGFLMQDPLAYAQVIAFLLA